MKFTLMFKSYSDVFGEQLRLIGDPVTKGIVHSRWDAWCSQLITTELPSFDNDDSIYIVSDMQSKTRWLMTKYEWSKIQSNN